MRARCCRRRLRWAAALVIFQRRGEREDDVAHRGFWSRQCQGARPAGRISPAGCNRRSRPGQRWCVGRQKASLRPRGRVPRAGRRPSGLTRPPRGQRHHVRDRLGVMVALTSPLCMSNAVDCLPMGDDVYPGRRRALGGIKACHCTPQRRSGTKDPVASATGDRG